MLPPCAEVEIAPNSANGETMIPRINPICATTRFFITPLGERSVNWFFQKDEKYTMRIARVATGPRQGGESATRERLRVIEDRGVGRIASSMAKPKAHKLLVSTQDLRRRRS